MTDIGWEVGGGMSDGIHKKKVAQGFVGNWQRVSIYAAKKRPAQRGRVGHEECVEEG